VSSGDGIVVKHLLHLGFKSSHCNRNQGEQDVTFGFVSSSDSTVVKHLSLFPEAEGSSPPLLLTPGENKV
jgi:hypothetical protein